MHLKAMVTMRDEPHRQAGLQMQAHGRNSSASAEFLAKASRRFVYSRSTRSARFSGKCHGAVGRASRRLSQVHFG